MPRFMKRWKEWARAGFGATVAGLICTFALAGTVTYVYDDAGRLKKVTYPDSSTKDYKLDPAGNRTNVQAAKATGGSIGFVAASVAPSVNEGAGTVQLSVARSGASTGAVTVTYATVASTATSPADYTLASGTLSWAAGDLANKTITVAIANDAIPEPTERFFVYLSNPTGGAVLGDALRSTVSITDNDAPTFSIANNSRAENSGALTFSVSLTPSSSQSYEVNYATSNGTAVAGQDYTAKSGKLIFAPNQTANTISIALTPDTQFEADETFTVTLSSPTNGAQLGAATATGTITNDDTPPTFGISDVQVNENATPNTVTFTVAKTGSTPFTHSVSYQTTTGGTATAGSDFVATSGTLTFAPSDTFKTFTVTIVNDTLGEGDEFFNVLLSGATNGAAIGQATAKATIRDDEPGPSPGTLQFTAVSVDVNEGSGNLTLQVTRTGGSAGAASVSCGTGSGTAVANVDYTPVNTLLTWGANDSSTKQCVIPILDPDSIFQADRAVQVYLTNASGAAFGDITLEAVVIHDNDAAPTFSISTAATVTEPGASVLRVPTTFTVTRSGGTTLTQSVDYSTVAGTAQVNADFWAASGTLTFAPNETVKTFTVTVLDDPYYEANETFSAVLSNSTNGAIIAGSTATTTIVNDDPFPVLSISNPTAYENMGVISFSVTMNPWSEIPVTVTASTSNGTATAGTHYTASGNVTLYFPPFTGGQAFQVAITNNNTYEGSRTFFGTLSNPTAGAVLDPAHTTGTATILEDDPVPVKGTIQFSQGSVSVIEGTPTLTLTVTRENGKDGPASVVCRTANGTAINGQDYDAVVVPMSWADQDASNRTCTIPIGHDDTAIEGNETFVAQLTDISGPTLGLATTETVTINDNDSAPVGFNATVQVNGPGPVNLRALANAAGYNGAMDATITFVVPSGVLIQGTAGVAGDWTSAVMAGGAAIDTGIWPSAYTMRLTLKNMGTIRGGGGAGGSTLAQYSGVHVPQPGDPDQAGGAGGDAIFARVNLTIDNAGGTIQGGGGGGGSGGGWWEIVTWWEPEGGFENSAAYPFLGAGGGGGAPNGQAGFDQNFQANSGSNGTVSGGGSGGPGAPIPSSPSRTIGTGGSGGDYGTSGGTGSDSSGAPSNDHWDTWGIAPAGSAGAAGYAVRSNGNVVSRSGGVVMGAEQ